jgi:O-Glycosyl hydrolase family 30
METENCSRRCALKTMLAGTAAGLLHATEPHHDLIRLDSEYQTIENFSASDCWSMQKLGTWSLPNRNRVADLLFSQTGGIGLSCWRFNIGGGITDQINNPWRTAETFEIAEGKYDWTRQSPERWFLGAAKARGVPQFLAFVNSPPGRMTRTGITYGQRGTDTTNLKPGFEGQFARYLVDILEHFRTNPDKMERIGFDYISPVNEPNVEWNGLSQEGCRASNEDCKAVLRALDAELKKRKCPTGIAGMEVSGLPPLYSLADRMSKTYNANYGNYLDEFLGDPGTAGMLNHRFSYHDYGSDLIKGQLVENRQTLRKKFDQYPGWKPWMSEYCVMTGSEGKGGGGRDLTMSTALDVARIIHLDLTLVGVTAWQWWTAVSGVNYKDGLIFTDWKKPGDAESIITSRLLWAIGNYSRFVRPGMRRVELEGKGHDIRGLMGSAYKDEKERRVVAVYINVESGPQTVQLDFDLGGRRWRPKSIALHITSDREGDELKEYPSPVAGAPIEIPARSVVTVTAQFT